MLNTTITQAAKEMKTLSTAFKIATALSLLGWLLLFAYPLWPQTARALVLTLVVVLLCAMYAGFVFFGRRFDAPGPKVKGGFSSLGGVINLFKSPRIVLAGWIHYLAFDLMVGLFIVTDAARVGILHWWCLPALFLTLMFGPAGLLLYLAMRLVMLPDTLALAFF